MPILRKLTVAAGCYVVTAVLLSLVQAADDSSASSVIDAFLTTVRSNQAFQPEQLQKAEQAVATLRADPDGQSIAITEALREFYPDFRSALASLGEENIGAAIASLTPLKDHDDQYLAAEAKFFLARAYLLDERFEEALPLLVPLAESQHTLRGGEALFLQGIAEMQLLKHQPASASLARFLATYPNAPERMRVGAMRQLEHLKAFQEGTLSDVQLRMDFSRRRLTLADAGQSTRSEQAKIVDILAKLIKEAEERECSCKGGGKGSGKGQQQGEGADGDSQASGDGKGGQQGQKGGGSKGTDSDSVKRLHRGGPQSPWSRLRDKERDPVFNAIQEKFPGRYQQLIEQYYKSFQDETEG